MLPRGQRHSVSTEHWTVAYRVLAVEAYFKNNKYMAKSRRLLRRHFNIHRNAGVPSKNTINSWVQNFQETASATKK
jgi:hypothetical protein